MFQRKNLSCCSIDLDFLEVLEEECNLLCYDTAVSKEQCGCCERGWRLFWRRNAALWVPYHSDFQCGGRINSQIVRMETVSKLFHEEQDADFVKI